VTKTLTPSTLKVPGADLYYEVRGAGPVLLVIAGGPQDAGVFDGVARHLATRYTVVTYDPRGNSRSMFEGAPQELSLDVQADDAAALAGVVGVPVNVFGTSGGAQIALHLALRHSGLVRVVVAHEPPAMMLLDDPTDALAGVQALHDVYRRDGVDAAMAKFFSDNGLGEGPPPIESPDDAATFARVGGNVAYWLAHGMRPLSHYRPDVDALRTGTPRIVVGIGEQSVGQPIAAMGTALAKKLGIEPIVFPGDHMGFAAFAEPFATTLQRVLEAP
jgi:pimeloyl-ACP methyl ester carboxylesterase